MPSRNEYLALGGLAALTLSGTASGDDGDGSDPGDGNDDDGNRRDDPTDAGPNRLTVEPHDGVVDYPDVSVTISTSGSLGIVDGPETVEKSGLAVEGYMTEGDSLEVAYSGEIELLDWADAPINASVGGTRADPYILSGGGPRYRWLDGSDDVIEATVYQTGNLYGMHGYVSTEAFARWLSGALKERGISHDILHTLPVVRTATNRVACDRAMNSDNRPGAYYVWGDLLNDNGFVDDYNANGQGKALENPEGDTFVQRKDSNLLLTNRGGGGCAAVTGNVAVAAGGGLDTVREYEHGHASPDGFADSMHDAMHEFGHNMGFAHRGRDYCDADGGGIGYVDDQGRWNRTPCNPWNGCTNRCGTWIPYRERNTSSTQVVRHLYFTECTISHFREEMGPAEGNTAFAEHSGEVAGDCNACGCSGPQDGPRDGGCSGECSGTCDC